MVILYPIDKTSATYKKLVHTTWFYLHTIIIINSSTWENPKLNFQHNVKT